MEPTKIKKTLLNQADLTCLIEERPEEIYIIVRDFLKKKGIVRPSEDLLQDMVLGFLKYAENYDEIHGVRPLTYLYKCLDGLLKRRGKVDNLVRPSMAYHAKILQTITEMVEESKSDRVSILEVARRVGCPPEAVLKSITGVYSVESLIPPSEDGNPWDILLMNNSSIQSSHVDEVEERDFIDYLLGHLSVEEKFIVQSRVGMLPKLSLKELGEIFELSKERIRQIENKAYDKLRKALILHAPERDAGRLLKLIVREELGIKRKETDEDEESD